MQPCFVITVICIIYISTFSVLKITNILLYQKEILTMVLALHLVASPFIPAYNPLPITSIRTPLRSNSLYLWLLDPIFLKYLTQKYAFKWRILARRPALTDLTHVACEASKPCENVSACLLPQAEHVYIVFDLKTTRTQMS